MLDELLGRADLKERVGELEEEVERLEAQLEAESDRRAEAVRERQAAQEEVNRLEDRIADLEGRLERAQSDERVLAYRGTERLSGGRFEAVLDRLESVHAPPEGALTAMVEERVPAAVEDAFGEHAALVRRAAPCLVLTDDAGLVSAALDVPLAPDPFVERGERFAFERSWFRPAGTFTLALVRSDLFAVGAYDGAERRDAEGFHSDVHGQHSKGGFSQARFERRRDEQIDDHLDRCRDVLEDRDPERLIVVGERTVLDWFADVADATASVDATGDPEDALGDALESFFSATLYRI